MNEIKNYWDERAREQRGTLTATTNDVYLRQLEASVMTRELACEPSGSTILDVGCGDGQTTLALANALPQLAFHGIDFSPEMIVSAEASLAAQPQLQGRVSFSVGSVIELDQAVSGKYQAIVTNRCLINLTQREQQYAALRQIAAHLQDGGLYLATENFSGGQVALNRLRVQCGLPEISVRWHNLYFDEAECLAEAERLFHTVELVNFSSMYYLITRVVYSALCKLDEREPDYMHPINKIATELPQMGDFSPIKLIRARASQTR
jgi:ubiquinone/menaquinone biosynthesis C-methylase UbiE